MLALVACSALLVAEPDAPAPSDTRSAYQEAKTRAGRSPEEQVKLALWCEARGLTAERLHHLTLAVLADPRNAVARGLMGLVSHNGRWQRPEVVADKLKADPDRAATLAEYQARRLKAAYTADAQYSLGVWCEEHGLKEQAKSHLTAVTRLDPKRESAWKKLGYRKHEGHWVTDAQLAAEKAEIEAQKVADRKWRPLLEKYKVMLDQPSKRAEAEAALAEITDPRAVPMIGQVFAKSETTQSKAVQLLGQVESPAASRALAFLAVFARSAEARRTAAETLRGRDSREFLGQLIALIRDPIKYEVKPVGGPGSPGVLFVGGKRANVRRVYAPPPPPNLALMPGDEIVYDADGLPVVVRYGRPVTRATSLASAEFTFDQYLGRVPVSGDRRQVLDAALASPDNSYGALVEREAESTGRFRQKLPSRTVFVNTQRTETDRVEVDIPIGRMMVESQRTALAAEQQLEDDVRAIEGRNVTIRDSNARVRSVLKVAIGQDLGDDREAWNRSWVERQGYVYRATSTDSVPTFVENVPLNYQPAPVLPTVSNVPLGIATTTTASLHHSCFAAGTTVRTIDGDRPIESIRAGDLVLAQDTKAGGLGYQAVVAVFHNPPSPTLRVRLGEGGGESVVATGIHRFWKAGHGWTMARDLKVGDLVRTLGGVSKVEAVEADKVQPVFNLEVGEGHSFLVGKLGALVHDNSLVEAVTNPFDAGTSKP